ncbi:MAG: hypothetical protein HC799_17595, partial [Limnothrix sp. RL_2_0]|nr:hypothetical protein [Limnothrix sp. RL_2_0]
MGIEIRGAIAEMTVSLVGKINLTGVVETVDLTVAAIEIVLVHTKGAAAVDPTVVIVTGIKGAIAGMT